MATKQAAEDKERKILAAKDLEEAERRLNAEKQKMELDRVQKLELIKKQNALSKKEKDREFKLSMKTSESENTRVA